MAEVSKLSLSREEIAEFTRAYTRERQLAFLRNNGIRHYVDNNGWPVVTLAAIGVVDVSVVPRPAWKPSRQA